MYRRVLVFGAHPDDEIKMAGTIVLLREVGVEVTVVTMTDGCEGYPDLNMKSKVVEMRRKEMEECDKVLGTERVTLGIPDMLLRDDKATVLRCVEIIRSRRPEAVFTHGPEDRHRDHRATHFITKEAWWHAGEPVLAELGAPWKCPLLFYFRGVAENSLPRVEVDVTSVEEYRFLALATQVSQHTLFSKSREDFVEEAERVRRERPKSVETFWISEWVVFSALPDL